MDVKLPEKITKKMANNARVKVASAMRPSSWHHKKTEDEAQQLCYMSIIKDFLQEYEIKGSFADRPDSNDKTELIFNTLQQAFPTQTTKETRTGSSRSRVVVVKLTDKVKVDFYWQTYHSYISIHVGGYYELCVDTELDALPQIIDVLKYSEQHIADWQELAEECVRDYKKKEKQKEIRKKVSGSVSEKKLEEAGLIFKIEHGEIRDKIFIQVSPKQKVRFYLSHKNFDKVIDKIVETAQHLKQLFETADLDIKIEPIGRFDNF